MTGSSNSSWTLNQPSTDPKASWSLQHPTAPPSREQPWEDSTDLNICGIDVRLGLSDVGMGTIIFVHCEVDALWAIVFRGQRQILTTHEHFPKPHKMGIVGRDEVITIHLLAVLPPVEVDGWTARWQPRVFSLFRPGEELRSKTFVIEGMELMMIFYPLGEKYGTHCTFFLRAAAQTQHIFAFYVNNERRCAAHEWLREGAWGFPLFGPQVLKKGPINLSIELLGPIPPVKVQNDVANWILEWYQIAPFNRGEEVRSSAFRLRDIELSIFYYPKGTKEGDGEHLALFLKSSRAFAAQMCVDQVGPRSLSHDGRGVWGYPNFCAITLPDSLAFKVEVLCWRDQSIPRRLHVSHSLCQRANLAIPPPPSPNSFQSQLVLLWLGGDAGSISRALMAWYFSVLGVEMHWCQGAPGDNWSPYIGMTILAVATGDDELIGVQDKLAQRLGITQNDPATTWYRQHKYAQRFAVEPQHEDYCLVQAEFDTLRKAIEGIGGYPAVVKIPLSDSSAGVSLVENDAELDAALKSTMGPATHWDDFQHIHVQDEFQKSLSYRYISPRQVLVERMFVGVEYVANCVSAAGVHIVSDCWVSGTKIPEAETKRPLYDTQALCDIPDAVHAFVLHALDACGVRYGASHLELIVCEDTQECRLIELNARLAGDFPRAHACAETAPGSDYLTRVGANQFSLLALSVVNESEFIEYAYRCNRRPGRIKEHATAVFLCSTRDCKLLGKGMAALCMLPTFNGLRRAMGHLPVPAPFHPLKLALDPCKDSRDTPRFAEYGSSVLRTMSLRTCPGVVLLRSSDVDAIQRDVLAIRALEENGLYGEPLSIP
eukprot:GEMP01008161.1.p1 GENE.GEMP01008161.1~~GEMP01008161.1.p1  ORF type:complete len:827 (+),score=160.64 GEMP01008161.1:151-2631(+)